MRQEKQPWTLIVLTVCVLGLAVGLQRWQPSVHGLALRDAEFAKPLIELQPTEYGMFFGWLKIDTVFAILYTVFFSWELRWLAARTTVGWLDTLGRSLSWVMAFAIVFNLAENVILWMGASIGTRHVSPLLVSLVKLQRLSVFVFGAYVLLWLVIKLWRRHPPVGHAVVS